MSQSDPPLTRIWAARDRLKELTTNDPTSDKLPSVREAMAEAIEALLIDCGKPDAPPPPEELRAIDEALAPHAADLKGGLLKALRLCSCAIGLLRLHLLCEQTRRLLCAAPAKGVATYLEEALCADIDKCASPQCLSATAELMNFMLAQNRLKRELAGHELPAPHKKSVRTTLNRATKKLADVEAQIRKQQQPSQPKKGVIMDRDVRLDDAEEAERREAANAAAMDALFAKASITKDDAKPAEIS